ESFREAAAEQGVRLAGVVRVVAVGLAGQNDVRAVMHVVVPLRIEALGRSGRAEPMRLVLRVLEHEVDRTLAARSLPHRARDLGKYVRSALVPDRVYRIEPQAVEAVFGE